MENQERKYQNNAIIRFAKGFCSGATLEAVGVGGLIERVLTFNKRYYIHSNLFPKLEKKHDERLRLNGEAYSFGTLIGCMVPPALIGVGTLFYLIFGRK